MELKLGQLHSTKSLSPPLTPHFSLPVALARVGHSNLAGMCFEKRIYNATWPLTRLQRLEMPLQ
jgi:hypothetical protein